MNRGPPPKKVPSGAREEETKMIKVKIWQVNTEMASQICEMQNKKQNTIQYQKQQVERSVSQKKKKKKNVRLD